MKSFRFQQFEVSQSSKVFRVGTDGVLLGAMCSVENAETVLEVGSGSGLISLMIAQRNPNAKISAIDLSKEAALLSKGNFQNSKFSERMNAFQGDYKNYVSKEKFDFIVCNPPYFEENESVKDVLARQKVELQFEELISKSSQLLTETGVFSVIIPSESSDEFIQISKNSNLHLIKKVNIFGIEGGVLKRNVLEFSLSPQHLVQENFVIEKSPRKYSDEYLELTKDFHVFHSK
mgnify:CR=1 FL=1